MNYKKLTSKHAESRLYGNIGGWLANGENFTTFLEAVESKGFEELTIRLHCYGGSVFEGNVIQNAMSRSKLKINVIIDGIAASMGFMFLTGTSANNISIAENGFGMIHRPSAGTVGDVDEHLAATKLLRDIETNFVKAISARSGLPANEVRSKWLEGKDHWLNAEEMVKYGFAGKVVPAVTKDFNTLKIEDLTNMQIDSVYNKFVACLPTDAKITTNNKSKMKQLLISTLALAGLTAESSDTAVIEAVKAELKKRDDRIKELEDAAKAETTKAIDNAIAKAEADGKIVAVGSKTVADVKAELKKVGETAGVETLNTVIAGMNAKSTPIIESIKNEGKNNTEGKTWEWYQKENPQALEKMTTENPEQFKQLYKAEFGVEPEL